MKDLLKEEIVSRWKEIFSSLKRGDDVSLGKRLRTEGLMEAASIIGSWDKEDQYSEMQLIYRDVYGVGIENLLGKEVIVVCNFPEKNISGIKSQALILGSIDKE